VQALSAMRLVFLDAGPIGLLTNPRGRSKPEQCRRWVNDLAAAGVRVFVPEIADYEVRRKLIHIGATAGVRRLDQVKATLDYAPLTTDVMLLAAEFGRRCEAPGYRRQHPRR
jgi:predicted nucleic acid-binding protein